MISAERIKVRTNGALDLLLFVLHQVDSGIRQVLHQFLVVGRVLSPGVKKSVCDFFKTFVAQE